MIIALTKGLGGNIVAFTIMITFPGSGFISITSYIRLKKKLSTPEQYVKEIDETDYQKIIAKILNEIPEIIVNYPQGDNNNKRHNNNPIKKGTLQVPFFILLAELFIVIYTDAK